MPFCKTHRRVGVLCASAVILLSGCSEEPVRTYRAPKDSAQPVAVLASGETAPTPNAASAPSMAPAGEMPHLHWDLPAGWEEQPAGERRMASFTVNGEGVPPADIAIIPLPLLNSREADIVNLWREQLNLAPVEDAELAGMSESVQVGEETAKLYELLSDQPILEDKHKARILVAMLPKDGVTWFFKITGEAELVANQKNAFKSFLKSITFHYESHDSGPVAAAPAASAPANSGAVASGGAEGATWQAPASWQVVPTTPELLAKFSAGTGSSAANITISRFPGDVGGLFANVNRWRGQIQLAPITEAELPSLVTLVDVLGGRATLVDMTNDKAATGNQRLIAAIVSRDGQSWFYKMMGDAGTVGREKDAFVQFVQSVRYSP